MFKYPWIPPFDIWHYMYRQCSGKIGFGGDASINLNKPLFHSNEREKKEWKVKKGGNSKAK
jgi:hypothetical protein